MGVQGWIVHGRFSLLQTNHTLSIRSISHCVDIIYVFLYLIFRHFIYIDAIKTNAVYRLYTFVTIVYLYLAEISSTSNN